jgi:hypothetical protein
MADLTRSHGEITGLTSEVPHYRHPCSILGEIQRARPPDTLTARHNLARWIGDAGDAAGPTSSLPRSCPVRSYLEGMGRLTNSARVSGH